MRSIALYLEDDGDGERWCAALAACADAGIGVAVLKAGLSRAGAAAAQAHTGAVAGDGRVFRALAEEAGAAWASDPHELLELAKALAVSRRGGALPGGGVAVMTCSGGDSSVAADLAEELALPLPALAPETLAELGRLLPAAAVAANPLDYTSLLWDEPDALRKIVRALAADPLVERLLVLYDEPDALDGAAAGAWAAVLAAVRDAAAEVDAPGRRRLDAAGAAGRRSRARAAARGPRRDRRPAQRRPRQRRAADGPGVRAAPGGARRRRRPRAPRPPCRRPRVARRARGEGAAARRRRDRAGRPARARRRRRRRSSSRRWPGRRR